MISLFTIVIPTYNRAILLPRAIQSVIDQTMSDWELIIVDDGSTDNTKQVVGQYRDPRIKYVYQENQERSAARNRGIQEAKGEWICFLDSDDEFPIDRLAQLEKSIASHKNKKALYFSDITFRTDEKERTVHYTKVKEEKKLNYLFLNIIGTPQVCLHRDILRDFLFNIELNNGEDLELWSRVQTNYPLIYLENVSPVIANEHENRSVSLKRNNPGVLRLKTLDFMFTAGHPGDQLPKKIKRQLIADTQFNVAKHHMINNRKQFARKYIFKSLITDWKNLQRKHRLLCLLHLILNNIPKQYQY